MVKIKSFPWFPIVVTIAIVLIPLYFLKPTKFIFASLGGDFTIYGTGLGLILILGFLKWASLFQWLRRKISAREFRRNIMEVLSDFGLRWDRREVLAGLIIGASTGLVAWSVGIEELWINARLVAFAAWSAPVMVFLAPLFEETLFRGYLINKVLDSIGNDVKGKTLAILGSILVFSWMHVHSPWNKVLPAVVFTAVYLWGWKRNLTAAMVTHAMANAVIISLAFLPLGFLWTAGVFALSGTMVVLLVVVLRVLGRA